MLNDSWDLLFYITRRKDFKKACLQFVCMYHHLMYAPTDLRHKSLMTDI